MAIEIYGLLPADDVGGLDPLPSVDTGAGESGGSAEVGGVSVDDGGGDDDDICWYFCHLVFGFAFVSSSSSCGLRCPTCPALLTECDESKQ